MLQIVGERLRGLFPNDGTIASIGGTQFALLINETGAAADAFAAEALARIAEPIDYGGTALNIAASIGIAAYPDDGGDAATLDARAGVALSAASAVNGNAVRRFFDGARRAGRAPLPDRDDAARSVGAPAIASRVSAAGDARQRTHRASRNAAALESSAARQ